ncbi:hypothetical protein TIFTF001_023762 [Ficus carica]|uniref:Uncharacterized protein n=1 Tax=Ficus carica TaxID=3494 RepID=A0AA88AX93_FICCA|nr:hypothetical protein TIFTF001_023762 [Ficus carica]
MVETLLMYHIIIYLTSHYPFHPKSSQSSVTFPPPATDAGDPPPAPTPAAGESPFSLIPFPVAADLRHPPTTGPSPQPAPRPPAPGPPTLPGGPPPPASPPPASPSIFPSLSLPHPSPGPPHTTPDVVAAGEEKRERREWREKGFAGGRPGLGPVVEGRRWVAGGGKVTGDREDFGWKG